MAVGHSSHPYLPTEHNSTTSKTIRAPFSSVGSLLRDLRGLNHAQVRLHRLERAEHFSGLVIADSGQDAHLVALLPVHRSGATLLSGLQDGERNSILVKARAHVGI